MMADTCYVCDSPELAPGADLRNPTCAEHAGARDHVVSMQSASAAYGGTYSVAVCPCGWSARRLRGPGTYDVMTGLVRAHWLAIAGAEA